MTCPCPLCTANRAIWNAAAERIAAGVPSTYDPVASLDVDTLVRSFGGGLSRSARREQRRPRSFVADELGYTPTGTWSGGDAA